MKMDDAIAWVDDNKGLICEMAQSFSTYAPYDVIDYIQDAYTAAVDASLTCQRDPKLVFEAVFKNIFKRAVAKVTPISEESLVAARKEKRAAVAKKSGVTIPAQEGEEGKSTKKTKPSGDSCKSFPLTARSYAHLEYIPISQKHMSGYRSHGPVDIEKVYEQKLKPILSDREREVMELSLGLTKDGALTENEIANRLGVTRRTVRKCEERVYDKVGRKCLILNFPTDKEVVTNKRQIVINPEEFELPTGVCEG